MTITKTATAFFVGALIAGGAQGAQSPGITDYLCPGTDGSYQIYVDWPLMYPPAPGCLAFNFNAYSSGNTYSSSSSGSFSSGLELRFESPPKSVPEPETLAIFLAGLGLIGFMAGRKKKST